MSFDVIIAELLGIKEIQIFLMVLSLALIFWGVRFAFRSSHQHKRIRLARRVKVHERLKEKLKALLPGTILRTETDPPCPRLAFDTTLSGLPCTVSLDTSDWVALLPHSVTLSVRAGFPGRFFIQQRSLSPFGILGAAARFFKIRGLFGKEGVYSGEFGFDLWFEAVSQDLRSLNQLTEKPEGGGASKFEAPKEEEPLPPTRILQNLLRDQAFRVSMRSLLKKRRKYMWNRNGVVSVSYLFRHHSGFPSRAELEEIAKFLGSIMETSAWRGQPGSAGLL